MQTDEQKFELLTGEVVTLSVWEGRLLFIHGEFTSSQFRLDGFGVQVTEQPTNTKLALMFTEDPENYLSIYFKASEHKRLVAYFITLGYPTRINVQIPSKD